VWLLRKYWHEWAPDPRLAAYASLATTPLTSATTIEALLAIESRSVGEPPHLDQEVRPAIQTCPEFGDPAAAESHIVFGAHRAFEASSAIEGSSDEAPYGRETHRTPEGPSAAMSQVAIEDWHEMDEFHAPPARTAVEHGAVAGQRAAVEHATVVSTDYSNMFDISTDPRRVPHLSPYFAVDSGEVALNYAGASLGGDDDGFGWQDVNMPLESSIAQDNESPLSSATEGAGSATPPITGAAIRGALGGQGGRGGPGGPGGPGRHGVPGVRGGRGSRGGRGGSGSNVNPSAVAAASVAKLRADPSGGREDSPHGPDNYHGSDSLPSPVIPAARLGPGDGFGRGSGPMRSGKVSSCRVIAMAATDLKLFPNAPPVPQEQLPCKWRGCGEHLEGLKKLWEHVEFDHIGRRGLRAGKGLELNCHWNTCNTHWKRRCYILSHIKVHIPYKEWVCSLCPKDSKGSPRGFKRNFDFAKHLKNSHQAEWVRLERSIITGAEAAGGASRGDGNGERGEEA